jgi:hypothetical protein
MFPVSSNKNFKRGSIFNEDLTLREKNDSLEKDFDIDEKENNEFYNYIRGEEKTYDNYVPKMYRNNTFYNYKALDFLIKEEPLVEVNSNVFLCAFHVNQSGKLPFLQFVLNKLPKNLFGDFLTFPCFSYNGKTNILDECISKLHEVCGFYKETSEYKYVGYTKEEGDIYMFYDLSNVDFQVQELYRHDKMWLVLVDEILNYQSVCGFEIHKHVSKFLQSCADFYLLFDESEEPIESPIVCYTGTHKSKLRFSAIFGCGKSENDAIVGPYYYFTTYEKAFENGGWSKNLQREFRGGRQITEDGTGKYDSGGIVRFAVFLGRCKVLLNYPEDEVDESPYKLETLKNGGNALERQTTRVTDYDGKWIECHDSVYVGKLELDDGRILFDAPYWVAKEYDQQTSLSFHHIDKRTLGNAWNENEHYYIQ